MTLWMVRGGKWGEHERVALENGLKCIGFEDMPDLSLVPEESDMA